MDMLEKHSLARKKSNVVVHNIKTEYKKGERKIYIVCEGRRFGVLRTSNKKKIC